MVSDTSSAARILDSGESVREITDALEELLARKLRALGLPLNLEETDDARVTEVERTFDFVLLSERGMART
jgi:hypothetical protein